LFENGLSSVEEPQIEATDDLGDALGGVEVVIEAVTEELPDKKSVFRKVENLIDRPALLASTTSGLDPDAIAEDLEDADRFVVMHFWNPAHLVPLVEVLGSSRTEASVVEEACLLVRSLGKHPVRLNIFVPGFLGVRLQQSVVREAVHLLESGVASAEDIDAATRLSFGARFPIIGPLETTDLGGLDVILSIHEYLLSDLDSSKQPQALVRRLVGEGSLGVKSGRGFYDWETRDAAALAQRRDEELIARVKALRALGELTSV
jgi:3-hydroxybutyryl-CoA dehydrogenase